MHISQGIPLFTTPKIHPWYTTQSYIPLRLPTNNSSTSTSAAAAASSSPQPSSHYLYRYAIHRSGKFHRWEQESDSLMSDFKPFHAGINTDDSMISHHSLMLPHLIPNESYIVSTVLGVTTSPPDIEKIQMSQNAGSIGNVADMLSHRLSSHGHMRHGSSNALLSSSPSMGSSTSSGSGKKKVGFAPSHGRHNRTASFSRETSNRSLRRNITLKSTDGVVVASAFLPVHLNRSEDGEWTAAWDYEALLSMQTHLRVTRIGTVKWRGWHGNFVAGGGSSSGDSPETGVPVNEREKVERCLRPFNCVPVWCDTVKFGEM